MPSTTPATTLSTGQPATARAESAARVWIAQGRDLRLDVLRGFCVLAMIVNHISGGSPLHLLTGGDRFFTSAAAGFIVISGFTAGMVYRRLIERDGLVPAMLKGWRRAWSLYLLTVGLTFFLVPISEFFNVPWASGLDLSRSLKFVLSVLTLHQTYTLVNILVLYTLLFAALPAALLLLAQGYGRGLLAASWLLWLVYQFYPDIATVPWTVTGGYLFAFSAWQVLFFTPLVLTYQWGRIPDPAPATLRRLHLLTGLATAALIGYYALFNLPAGWLPGPLHGLRVAGEALYAWSWEALFEKAHVGLGRIITAAAVFGFLFLSLTRWWGSLSRLVKPLLLPLGQHALYAWTAHIFVIVVLGLGLKALGLDESNPWLNTVLQIAAVALLWHLTRRQFLAVTPRTRPYWQASPLVLALLTVLVLQLPQFAAGATPAGNASSSETPVAESASGPMGTD